MNKLHCGYLVIVCMEAWTAVKQNTVACYSNSVMHIAQTLLLKVTVREIPFKLYHHSPSSKPVSVYIHSPIPLPFFCPCLGLLLHSVISVPFHCLCRCLFPLPDIGSLTVSFRSPISLSAPLSMSLSSSPTPTLYLCIVPATSPSLFSYFFMISLSRYSNSQMQDKKTTSPPMAVKQHHW